MRGPIGRWFILAALLAGLGFSTGAGDRLNPLWSYWAPQKILFTPTVAWDGSVYIATSDSLIRGISPNGVAMWSSNAGGLPSAAMALQGNVLYFPISDELVACSTSGQILWHRALGSTLCSTPAVAADGTIYETLVKGGVVALNSQGQILWSYLTADPVVTSPAITHTGLIFVLSTKHVYLLSSNGAPVAIFPLTDQPISPMALDANDYPYFWGATGSAYALAQNGTFRWKTDPPTGDLIPTGASPVASSSAVFLASSLGTPPPKSYAVSGTVLYNNTGLSGVTISAGSGNPSTVTGSDGTFSLSLPDGSYTLTPSKSQYTFTPSTQSVTVSGADVPNQNFTATFILGGGAVPAQDPAEDPAEQAGVAEASSVTYNAGAYRLSTGADAWSAPLEIGGPYAPALATEGILLLPSYGDQKVYLLNQLTGSSESTANVGGAPHDLVLADTSAGTRLYFQSADQILYCFSSTLSPEPSSPWTQIGAGPRHLYRRDDPPTVTLTAPTGEYPVGGGVTMTASALDDLSNPKVRFLVDGVAIADGVADGDGSTFSATWDTTTYPNGNHTVQAEARDSAGNVSRSLVTVEVENSTPPPQEVWADSLPLTFTWDPGGETQFRVEVSTNGAFKPILASSRTPKDPWLKTTNWTPSNRKWATILGAAKNAGEADVTIVWRVVGKQGGPMVASGGFITIRGIVAPTLASPAEGAEVGVSAPPTFTWSADHTSLFQVRVSDTAGFKVLRLTSKTSNKAWLSGTTTWTPDADKWKRTAQGNARLYWEVITKDAIGRKATSVVHSVKIVSTEVSRPTQAISPAG
jgi:hypothetical protein